MILNIENKYKEIEQDIITNQRDIFNLLNYYSRKYAKYSDRLNDVNTGLFIDDLYRPVLQIFLRNKTGYIRTRLVFNKEGNKIIDKEILNWKI